MEAELRSQLVRIRKSSARGVPFPNANDLETIPCPSNTRVHQMKRVLASKSVFSQPGFRVGAGSRWLKRLLRAGRCALRPAKRPLARVAEEPVNRAVRDGWRQGPGAGAVAMRTSGPRRHAGTVSRVVGLWDWTKPLVTCLFHLQLNCSVFGRFAAS